jgi:hypothetical protein
MRLKRDGCGRWMAGLLLAVVLHGCTGGDMRASGNESLPKGDGVVKVQFERSGGFAAIKRAITVDSQSLPPSEARELRDRVDRADFFNLPAEIIGPKGADQFLYTLTVETEGQRHTVRTTDAAAPARLKPLIDWLNMQGRATAAPSRPD